MAGKANALSFHTCTGVAAIFLLGTGPIAFAQADAAVQATYFDVAATYPDVEPLGYIDERLSVFGITLGDSVEDVVATATAQGFIETTANKNTGRRFELGARNTLGHVQIDVGYVVATTFGSADGGGVNFVSATINYDDLNLVGSGQYAELDAAFLEQLEVLERAFGPSTECRSRNICRLWETPEGDPAERFIEALELTQLPTALKMSLTTRDALASTQDMLGEENSIFERFNALEPDEQPKP